MKKQARIRMLSGLILIIFCLQGHANNVYGEQTIDAYEKVCVGNATWSTKNIEIGKKTFPVLEVMGKEYVLLDWLEEGFITEKSAFDFVEEQAYLYQEPIYIGNCKTYAVQVDYKVYVPVACIGVYYEWVALGDTYLLLDKLLQYNALFTIEGENILSHVDYPLALQGVDLWWEDNALKEYPWEVTLTANNRCMPYGKKEAIAGAIHLTTHITDLNGWLLSEQHAYEGQYQPEIWRKYEEELAFLQLEKKFPPTIVWATFKYPVRNFKKEDVVELWRKEKGSYYIVRDLEGTPYMVPLGSLDIPAYIQVGYQEITDEELERYVNHKEITSETKYFSWTDLYHQRTYVFEGENHQWKLVKRFVCSSGKNENPTPRGNFEVSYTIPYFGVDKGFRCKYALVLYRDYMYHSILFDKEGKYVKSGASTLGQRASHGCIRFNEADSYWLYTTLSVGTTVWIY